MKNARGEILQLLRCAALIVLTACGGARASSDIRLSEEWPAEPAEYEQAYEHWTRSGTVRQGYDQVLSVHGTFKSPAWRAAYVRERAETLMLPPNERAQLLATQRQEASEYHELELLVSTYHREENDLVKGERSVWRLALVDDEGNEVAPVAILKDRRPENVIRAEYPDMSDFDTAYVIRFPRTIDILGNGARRFSLKMASPRGGTELIWQAE